MNSAVGRIFFGGAGRVGGNQLLSGEKFSEKGPKKLTRGNRLISFPV